MTLNEIANKHKTDKGTWHHGYAVIYEKYLEPLRQTKQTLLELGVGGYEFPDRGGESLRMWTEYAPQWFITAIDKHRKDFTIPGVNILQYSQDDVEALTKICNDLQPSIIIDDASHINPLTIKSFEILWPLLAPGGLYIIEDTEASYWGIASDGTDYGGGDGGIVEYMKDCADKVNTPYSNVEFIHFYKGVIILKKK